MSTKAVILVVEDDAAVRNLMAVTLQTQDYQYRVARNGGEAMIELTTHQPDIMLLDLGLPDMDGIDIIRKVRTWSAMPIIVISARSEDGDKVEALDAGADDYLTKPFSVDELLARLRVALRRLHVQQPAGGESAVYENGSLRIDYAAGCAYLNGSEIHLTPIEYKLLGLLAKNTGKVLTHNYILKEIWGNYTASDVGSLRVFMAMLRKKLQAGNDAQPFIQTHIGIGYRMLKAEKAQKKRHDLSAQAKKRCLMLIAMLGESRMAISVRSIHQFNTFPFSFRERCFFVFLSVVPVLSSYPLTNTFSFHVTIPVLRPSNECNVTKEAQAVDRERFIAEIEACSGMLYRVAWSILRNNADCEDALQDTALKAWEKRNRLRDDRFFRTWITRILINACYDTQRKRRRTVPLDEVPEQTAASAPDPALALALEALPEKIRLPLVLCYSEGMSYEEAADTLRIPLSTLRGRIHRGKEQLRMELSRE